MSTDPLPPTDRSRMPWPAVAILTALVALGLAFVLPGCPGRLF